MTNTISNLKKYENDLDTLISNGEQLLMSIWHETDREGYLDSLKKEVKDEKARSLIVKKLPSFKDAYQIWYSESLALIKQLLPDRLDDFRKLFQKPKTHRKSITYENYVIEDALQGLQVTFGLEKVVGVDAAIPRLRQQLGIVKSVQKRFESSLFDIKQLVQADIFDSELESARELCKKEFLRGAGAIAGVVLEKHLAQVCVNHDILIKKKNPTISVFNDALKAADVYETPTFRKIQYLGDLRNLCDHKKEKNPSQDDVEELIDGVEKVTKTLF